MGESETPTERMITRDGIDHVSLRVREVAAVSDN